jgi:hypothetical protein
MKNDDGALDDTVTVPASLSSGQGGRHPLWDSGEHFVPPGKRPPGDPAATAQTVQVEVLSPLTAPAAAPREAARSPAATAQTVPVEILKPLTAPAAAPREAAKPAALPASASREAVKPAAVPASASREARAATDQVTRATAGQRGPGWLARHRVAVAIAAVALAAVIGVQRLTHAQRLAEEQRALAVARSAEAEALIGFMFGDLRDKLTPLGKLDLLDAAASKAVAYYDRAGNLLLAADDKPGAFAAYRAALAIAKALAAGAPTNPAWAQQITKLDATISTCCARLQP